MLIDKHEIVQSVVCSIFSLLITYLLVIGPKIILVSFRP